MKIGVIGTGRMGSTLGRLWAERGHQVCYGSRNVAEVADVLGGPVVTWAEAAEFAEVVVLAIPWYAFTDVERVIHPLVQSKVVVDCMNPLRSTGGLALGHKWSAGEEVAKTLHRAKVVKAFNHIYWTMLENPHFEEQSADLFYCSDDDSAKQVVAELANQLGFRPVDSGTIKASRLLEPLAALWIQLAFQQHNGTEFAFKLIGLS